MNKFIAKVLLVLLIAISVNTMVGIVRYNYNDPIAFTVRFNKSYITLPQKAGHSNGVLHILPHFDMSRENFPDTIVRKFDRYGFSNPVKCANPKIIFTGDSYLDDPFLNSDSGIQAKTNLIFNYN